MKFEFETMQMTIKKLLTGFFLLNLLSLSGCGQTTTSTYIGTETVSFANTAAISPTAVTVSLTVTNNDTVTGSLQSAVGRGNITGRPSGELALDYTLTQNYTVGPVQPIIPVTPTTSVHCGTYVGKLVLNKNQMSGTLSLTQPAAANGPVITPRSVGDACPANRTIAATKN